MATHGSVGEFNSDREDWISYTECLHSALWLMASQWKVIKGKQSSLVPVGQQHIS